MADVDEVGDESPRPQVLRGHFFVDFLLVRFFWGSCAVHAYFNCSVYFSEAADLPYRRGLVW